ncbi:MAG: hypothetical protein KDK10_00460 [Maritimibacter sp.]|nr:hypothetical protein [Maritimibacter sp.]
MTMMTTPLPVAEMHRMIDAHGAAHVARALVRALLARRRRAPRPAVPDRLRADVGLPPVEREMRFHWDLR